MTFLGVVVLVLLAGPLVTATVAAAVARSRHAMLVGIVAAGTALLFCGLGITVVAFGLGCALPWIVAGASCSAYAEASIPVIGLIAQILLGPGLTVAVLLAFGASAAAAALRRGRLRSALLDVVGRPPSRARTVARPVVILVLVAAVALNAAAGASPLARSGEPIPVGPVGTGLPPLPATQLARRAQVIAWYRYGGDRLWTNLSTALPELGSAGEQLADGDAAARAAIRSGCRDLGQWADDAGTYFTIPDTEQESAWERAQSTARSAASDCLTALDADDGTALLDSFGRITTAAEIAQSVFGWLVEQKNAPV